VDGIELERVTERDKNRLEAIMVIRLERRAKALTPPPAPRADDRVGEAAGVRHARLESRVRGLQLRPHFAGRKLAQVREKRIRQR
jgi:hypothetical protein